MIIAGLQKTSLLDYPDKVAAIIFTYGCTFRCGFCHNPELVTETPPQILSVAEVLEFLKKRSQVLDALVITGGEPTIHQDLPDFIKSVRKLGLLIKLDTNGTNPAMVRKLLKAKQLNYLAMDIKAPLDQYEIITGVKRYKNKVKESIKLIMNSGVPYEFRSTILPHFHKSEDLIAMAKLIKGADKYYLQSFLNQGKLIDSKLAGEKAFSAKQMAELAKSCRGLVKICEVR